VFADDVDMLGKAVLEIKEAFISTDRVAKKPGLKINQEKNRET
jgi:hypothetical protein